MISQRPRLAIQPADTIETIEETETSQPADPYTFTVEKSVDGSLNINGFAPNEKTKQAMIDQAKAIALAHPVIADIQIADGMPDQNWPDLIFAGIGAMAQVEARKI